MRLIALLLTFGLLGACSVLPQAEPTDVYLLPRGEQQVASGGAPFSGSIRIVKPQASQTLDSTHIAVAPKGALLSTYKGARWSDPAPALLRNRLLDVFQSDGRIAALSSDDDNLRADFELGGVLQAFQSQYTAQGIEVLVRFDARLVDSRQKIIASKRFEIHQPAAGTDVPSVVAAFGKASDLLGSQLLGWSLEQARLQPKNQ